MTATCPDTVPIDRSFARLAEGLIHYRHAGLSDQQGTPLYMAHAGPGSSRGLEPMMGLLAETRPVIAPDMPGNGDSAPPLTTPTDIPYYVDAAIRLLDHLQIDKIDFYGSHTGAFIGTELALRHPDRINRLVLDGVMLLSAQDRADLLADYAPEISPDAHGGHLSWAHNFMRDMMQFWPYYSRKAESRMPNDVPAPDMLHLMVLDVLKAIGTYHHAYHAAFSYDAAGRLPLLACPVLLTCTMRDPLHPDLAKAASLLPGAIEKLLPLDCSLGDRVQMIQSFLNPENP